MLSYLHALKTLNTAAIHSCGPLFVTVTPLHVSPDKCDTAIRWQWHCVRV